MERFSVTNFFVKWANVLTMILSLPIIILGIWMYTVKATECVAFLQPPLLVIGVTMFCISLIGCHGARKKSPWILWIYLVFMLFLILLLAIFTIFSLIVSLSGGNGEKTDDTSFKEYKLENYSPWLRSELGNQKRWKSISSCFSVYSYCDHLDEDYKTVDEYKKANLSPTESGCCRPPSNCKYNQVNATYFDLSSSPQSGNRDCVTYSNDKEKMCFDCDSCKGGVAYYIRKKWKVVAITNLIILFFLIIVYSMGCTAKKNASAEIEFQKIEEKELRKAAKEEKKAAKKSYRSV